MNRKRQHIVVGLLVGTFLAFGVTGVALATHLTGQDSGTLPITAPWGPANQDPSGSLRVVVTYEVKASGSVPQDAVNAVNDGIAAWNARINDRENAAGNVWAFDLIEFGSTSAATGAGSPSFSHNDNAPPGHGGGGGGGGGDTGNGEADITIQLKKGGGLIAGQAQSTIDADGFRVGGKIRISGSFLGGASNPATIQEITMHELGHLLSLGHHFNENDLMGQTVGHEDGSTITGISECDLDGFEEAHHWLTQDGTTVPHLNHDPSIVCP